MNNLQFSTLAGLLLTVVTTAQAATITSTHLLSEDLTDWSGALALQQFNPALGQLNSVAIGMSGQMFTTGGVENLHATRASTFSVQVKGSLSLDLPGLGGLAWTSSLLDRSATLDRYDAKTDLNGTSGRQWTAESMGGDSRSFTDAAQLTAFTGLGTVSAAISASAESVVGGPSNRYANFDTSVAGQVTVTYDYTAATNAVPEPESWMLMAAGLGLIGRLASRRRA